MAYNVGQIVNLGSNIPAGTAPGQSQYSSSAGQAKVIGQRVVNGQLYYDIDQTASGGGTGWVKASDLESSASRSTTGQTTSAPSTSPVEDFLSAFKKAQEDVIKEQVNFTKEFLANNPLAFDEELSKKSSEERFRPYYTQLLDDFTQDIQVKQRRSLEDETALLSELTRGKEFALGKETRTFQRAREAAKEGFAGKGLFFSGIAKTALGEQTVEHKEDVADIIARAGATAGEVQRRGATTREEDLLPGELSSLQRRQRELFGPEFGYNVPGAFQENVLEDVERQRRIAEEQRKARAIAAIGERYGEVSPNVTNFLSGLYA